MPTITRIMALYMIIQLSIVKHTLNSAIQVDEKVNTPYLTSL